MTQQERRYIRRELINRMLQVNTPNLRSVVRFYEVMRYGIELKYNGTESRYTSAQEFIDSCIFEKEIIK